MSSFQSRIAHKFATSPGGGNRASAPFFLDMAMIEARAALAFLDRAERDAPGTVHGNIRCDLEMAIASIQALADRCRQRVMPVRPPPTDLHEVCSEEFV